MEIEKQQRNLRASGGRCMWIDVLRALLIITVIVGHSNADARMIQIIFWFHMPLFFILSGLLLHMPQKSEWKMWAVKKAKRLLLPCFAFFMLCSILDGSLSISSFACFVVGGRRQSGVYWFATVLFLAEIAVSLIELHISSNKWKALLYAGCYGIAILESAFFIPGDTALIPNWLKLPWNIDVVPLAMAYLMLGYYGKKYITGVLEEKGTLFKGIAVGASIAVSALFVYLCWKGSFDYHLDMKNGHYANPVFALLFPMTFGVILTVLAVALSKVRGFNGILAYVGKTSMTMMYLHILIIGQMMRRVFGESYSIFLCVVIVLLLSCLFQWFIEKNKWLSLAFSGKSR